MRQDSQHLQTLLELVEPVCQAHGMAVVHLECNQKLLRVFIEHEDAEQQGASRVTLADCERVSRDLSTALDVADELTGPGSYRLEVSSPGLDRPLWRLGDFRRFAGQQVKIQTRKPLGNRRRFRGTLMGVEGDVVQVEQDGVHVSIPHAEIAKANVVYQF